MATAKRRRTATATSRPKPNKRAKYIASSDEAPATQESWEAEGILDERCVGKKLLYLIQWKGIDPETGDLYAPTWEPRENPAPDLVAAWEQSKAERKDASATEAVRRGRSSRRARVVESSPEPATPLGPAFTKCPSPVIHVDTRGDSFDPEEYERFSQLTASQVPSSGPTHTRDLVLNSTQSSAAQPEYRSSGIVPDSQSSVGESSFVPATQQTTGTTQQSSTENASQEDVTEDSGLLEIVAQAQARAPSSPASSIPETIYDNTADSQSQRRRLDALEQVRIPAVSETQDSSLLQVSGEVIQLHGESGGRNESQFTTQDEGIAPGHSNWQLEAQIQHQPSSAEHGEAPSPKKQSPRTVQEPPTPSHQISEHSEQDETSYFPYHSQRPLYNLSSGTQPSQTRKAPRCIKYYFTTANSPSDHGRASAWTEEESAIHIETSASGSVHASPNDNRLRSEAIRSCSLPAAQQTIPETEIALQSTNDVVEEEVVLRRDFACDSQTPNFMVLGFTSKVTTSRPPSREQNAQVIPPHHDLSTQADAADSTRPSVEEEEEDLTDCTARTERSTPDSRHDSSQETPEPSKSSTAHSSSLIAQPPSHPLPASGSQVPPRPRTPVPTSSLSTMETERESIGDEVRRMLKEALAEKQKNPFTPTRRLFRRPNVTVSSSTMTPAPAESSHVANPTSDPHLPRTGVSHTVDATEGMQSASTVLDPSTASAPTSLRTIALSRAIEAPEEAKRQETDAQNEEMIEGPATIVPAIALTQPTVSEEVSLQDDVMSDPSDDDDETESLLNDELQLDVDEYIIPLCINGRQRVDYVGRIQHHKDILDAFLNDRDNSKSSCAKVEDLLSKLRALETHPDLTFEEAGSSHTGLDGASQIEWLREYGTENSAKFKFLNDLFHATHDEEKHIVLVIENDNDILLNIIENFCKACSVQYSIPSKGRRSEPALAQGKLSVSIIPSAISPITRPPDVVVCLDGVHDAKVIRQKKWARNSNLDAVPVLHLVIPRTIGHIERCLSSSLSKRERRHTIVACLFNMVDQLGKPIHDAMPHASDPAAQVAEWLKSEEYPQGWPLGSIGSVKEVIEFQTQVSGASPALGRTKRPHDDDDFDPAKRMRFTPQPHEVPASSVHENEITHVSDSMPGTGVNVSAPQAPMTRLEETLEKERIARKAEQARYHEQEAAWDKQQTAHEDLMREYRLLLGKQQKLEGEIDTLRSNNATLRERLAARTTDLRTRDEELKQQRDIHTLSEDSKIAEITRLRTELAEEIVQKERAVKSAKITETTLDYTKEQYRAAQDVATTLSTQVTELEATVARLSHAALAQPLKLKEMHLGRQYDLQAQQIRSLRAEISILKKTIQFKEDEIARVKSSAGRPGVGTRGTSATPQPNKVRSRAASPANRLSNLRNG